MRPPRPAAAVLLLLAPALRPGWAAAQDLAGPGTARVLLDATAARDPFRGSASALYAPFVTPRWQVGVAPSYGWVDVPNARGFRQYTLGALANHVLPVGARGRLFAGAFLSTSDGTRAPAFQTYGVQAGALYFLAPGAGLRAEYRARRPTLDGAVWQQTVIVSLDPYAGGAAAGAVPWRPAARGAVDVALLGNVGFGARQVRFAFLQAGAAPFLARWAQAGATGSVYQSPALGRAPTDLRAFGRLYLPLAGRTVPFAEGFGYWTYQYNDPDGLLNYGLVGGVRRYVGANLAADVGVQWARPVVQRFGTFTYRGPDETSLRVGLATQLRRAR